MSAARTFAVEINQKQFQVTVSELLNDEEKRPVGDKLPDRAAKDMPGDKLPDRAANDMSGEASVRYSPSRRKLGSRPAAATSSSVKPCPEGTDVSRVDAEGIVRATMYGLIKEIFVHDGDLVQKGAKLLILEAMKMESEVLADRSGRVSDVNVKIGDTVETGDRLITLLPE